MATNKQILDEVQKLTKQMSEHDNKTWKIDSKLNFTWPLVSVVLSVIMALLGFFIAQSYNLGKDLYQHIG